MRVLAQNPTLHPYLMNKLNKKKKILQWSNRNTQKSPIKNRAKRGSKETTSQSTEEHAHKILDCLELLDIFPEYLQPEKNP